MSQPDPHIFPFPSPSSSTTQKTTIKRPQELAFFSFDDTHKCHPLSSESLRYYYPAMFDAPWAPHDRGPDLSQGFEHFEKYDEGKEDSHLDALLETLRCKEEREGERVEVDVVTWRGMMTKILAAPFDPYEEEFEMNVTYFDGTIFIEENFAAKAEKQSKEASRPPRRGNGPSQEMMQYWGYKFESLSTLPHPFPDCTRQEIESRPSLPVSTAAQFCSIVRTTIGSTNLLLAGEVDCIVGAKPSPPASPTLPPTGADTAKATAKPPEQIPYVELKTSQAFDPNDHRSAEKFERKLCKFWAQSFLLGIPKIVVGFRTQAGYLSSIQEFDTMGIPGLVKRGGGTWDGNVCVGFAAGVVEWLKGECREEGVVWRLKRAKGARNLTLSKVERMQGDGGIVETGFRRWREGMRGEKSGEKGEESGT
ncbi:unnamed protein product [Zymoseptoria tritici ST99CH_3D1]|nr:unnamed protein product [Zymoseptoria tritici ST99CH_3D1]